MNQTENNTPATLDLRRYIRTLKRGWPIYLASLLLILGLATYYACNKQEQYKVVGQLLIEDEKESTAGLRAMGGMTQMMRSFSLGGFSSSADNECAVLNSNDVRLRVVKTLGLNRIYVKKTGLLTKELLYRNSPIRIEAPDTLFETMPHGLRVDVSIHDGKADIKVAKGRFSSTYWSTKGATLPCEISTPFGPMQVLKTTYYDTSKDMDMFVVINNNQVMAIDLFRMTNVAVPDKKTDAIKLSIKDNRERGIDIINALIAAYNEKRSDHRNERAKTLVDQVNNRLNELQGELSETENRVTQFKQANHVNNPTLEAQAWLRQSSQAQAEATEAQSELSVYEMILNTLRNSDGYAMLPALEGVKDPSVTQYNELIIKRNTLMQSATPGNAALETVEQQIKPLRESIIKRAEKNIEAAKIKLNVIYSHVGQAQGKYNQMPGAEQQYYDLLRDRELKNDLYVFLLEKKENALLMLNDNSTPAFVLDKAYSLAKPDHTKAIIVYVIGLLLALLLPTLFLLWRMHRRDRVVEPCDLTPELEQRALSATADDVTALTAQLLQLPQGTTVHVVNFSHDSSAVSDLSAVVTAQGLTPKVQFTSGLNDYAQAIAEGTDKQRWLVLPDAEHTQAYLQLASADAPVMALIRPNEATRKLVNNELKQLDSERCMIVFLDRLITE